MISVQALMGRGFLERSRGDWTEARAAFMEAAAIAPDGVSSALAETHAALCGLALGGTANPWLQFEERFKAPCVPARAFERGENYWDGAPVSSLLIWAEGGRGNTIQFSRYVQEVASRLVVPITFAVQPELVELLTGVGLVNDDVDVEPSWPEENGTILSRAYGAHCSVLSLPAIFAARDWEPPAIPMTRRPLRRRVPLRIGLWWQGNPDYWDDARRSGSRAMFAPLEALIPRVSLLDLQAPPVIMNGGAPWEELRDFAAATVVSLLGEIDLVITTDTAMVHLAGALGIPTWLLLHDGCNWRWAPEGPATNGPLAYDSVRIFRTPPSIALKGPDNAAMQAFDALAGLVGARAA